MKIYKLIRCVKSPTGTFGILLDHADNPICNTVERGWNENKKNISCIPEGFYKAHRSVRHLGQSDSYEVYMLEKVVGRTLIQIHVANRPDELLGCIAPVTFWSKIEEKQGGGGSQKAFNKFMDSTEDDSVIGIWIKDSCWNGGIITNTGD